jgi:hypothetical protein
MLMFETARYDDVFLRPYESHFDQRISNMLIESTNGAKNVNPTTLAMAAGAFLKPSAVSTGTANLANGFGEKRFSFMMELRRDNVGHLGGGMRYILTGYTNHLGVSALSGHMNLDPNMLFYINNIFELRDTYIPTPHGNEHQVNVASSRHVLHNQGAADYTSMQSMTPQYTLRPEDIMSELEYSDTVFSQADTINGTSVLSGPRLSDRRNESRPTYLTNTIKSFQDAQMDSDAYDGGASEYDQLNTSQVWSHTRDKLRDAPVSANSFMSLLMASTSYKQTGFVSYSELCHLLPGMDQVAEVVMSSAHAKTMEYQPGQGENWNSMSQETLASTIIQQMTPAIMSDCLLTKVGFIATNDTIGSVDDVRVYAANGFTEGLDYSRYISHFIERLKREVLQDISHFNAVRYSVEVHIDMLNESYYKVSLDGGPFVWHTAPTFCDGLYAPVVSGSHDSLENMASDVSTMLHNISGELTQMVSSGNPAYGSVNASRGLVPATNTPYTGDTSL